MIQYNKFPSYKKIKIVLFGLSMYFYWSRAYATIILTNKEGKTVFYRDICRMKRKRCK